MHPSSGRPLIARVGFYIATIALVAIVWRVQHLMDSATFGPNTVISASSNAPLAPSENPRDWQQMGLNAISDMNSLLTTLTTALLGALGFLLSRESRPRHRARHLWSALICAMFGGVSLYFGYVGHLHVLWMIKNETFDPRSLMFILPSHAQFYILLAAVFFFADFAVHDLILEEQ